MTDLDREKPIFRTRHIAEALGMTTNFVRDQVDSEKLHATVNRKFGKRRTLRFSWNDVHEYDVDAAKRILREWNSGN